MNKNINVLAIDPGIKTGWATYHEGVCHSGAHDFSKARKMSSGDAYHEQMLFMARVTSGWRCNAIVIEEPTPRSMRCARIQYGMFAMPQLHASQEDIGYTVAYPNEVKKFLKGALVDMLMTVERTNEIAKIAGGNKNKINSVRYFYQECNEMPYDDNEADAYALLRYYMAKMEVMA